MTTFITVNAQWLRSDDRRHNVLSFFRRNRLDTILLQETHWTSELETKIKREWNGDAFFSSGTNTSSGAAVLISSRLVYNVIRVSIDIEDRVLNIILDLEERILNILKSNSVLKTNQTSNQNSPTPFFRSRCEENVAMLLAFTR